MLTDLNITKEYKSNESRGGDCGEKNVHEINFKKQKQKNTQVIKLCIQTLFVTVSYHSLLTCRYRTHHQNDMILQIKKKSFANLKYAIN